MYYAHYGLTQPPFRITPNTEFFFTGGNRGPILEALIYAITQGEGIIKVTGEVGSGKTMLCRMLLEKLPPTIESIYLANPSLTREEMLYAIADGLGLDIEGERVGIIMQKIQNRLEEKARDGRRVVVLVDEAHAMPPDTLEELRLLYNLQVGNAKLLQIVLLGQPELNAKLDQPGMRQLKDRIVHHFHMQPLTRDILENYLMFRMRTAGYHGPNIFSADAVKQIAHASGGLMRRVNVLADKALLAAFVENTHDIEVRHVQAAMRDSEMKPAVVFSGGMLYWAGGAALLLIAGAAAWWTSEQQRAVAPAIQPASVSAKPATMGQTVQVQPTQMLSSAATENIQAKIPDTSKAPTDVILTQVGQGNSAPNEQAVQSQATAQAQEEVSLFDQRMNAGNVLLRQKKAVASIQLYYVEEINRVRMEGFLRRASKLGVLSEIYLLPAKFGNKDGLRVLYGAYPTIEAAQNAVSALPKRYQEAFATSTYIF